MKKGPKVVYLYPLSTTGVEIKLIFAVRAAVFEIQADFPNFHYIWAWNLEFEERSQSCICTFYPRGSKLSLFLLYRQPFSRYGPIFKIGIFGHETWNLKKVPEVAYEPLFLLQEIEIELIFAVQAVIFEMEQFKVLISLIN